MGLFVVYRLFLFHVKYILAGVIVSGSLDKPDGKPFPAGEYNGYGVACGVVPYIFHIEGKQLVAPVDVLAFLNKYRETPAVQLDRVYADMYEQFQSGIGH